MRKGLFHLVLSLLLGAIGPAVADPGTGSTIQASNPVTVTICNKTSDNLQIALTQGSNQPSLQQTEGWLKIYPHNCTPYALQSGKIWVYARGYDVTNTVDMTWNGSEPGFCVTDSEFSQWRKSAPCPAGQWLTPGSVLWDIPNVATYVEDFTSRSDHVNLHFCNETDENAYVALVHGAGISGWWLAQAHTCSRRYWPPGKYSYFAYAMDRNNNINREWYDTGSAICVGNVKFDNTNPAPPCAKGFWATPGSKVIDATNTDDWVEYLTTGNVKTPPAAAIAASTPIASAQSTAPQQRAPQAQSSPVIAAAQTARPVPPAKPTAQTLYKMGLDLYNQTKRKGAGAAALPGTGPALLAVIQKEPKSGEAAKARRMLQSLVAANVTFPDWNGRSGLSNAGGHASYSAATGGPPQNPAPSRPPQRRAPVPSMWVSFSFAPPGLASDPDFGGDGGWGAAVDKNRQESINKSGDMCRSHSQRPGWCGDGNGGTLEVCHGTPGTKWVALATSNDGTLEDWGDGEAVGYSSQADAAQSATGNCGGGRCQLVWSQSVECGEHRDSANTHKRFVESLGCVHIARLDLDAERYVYKSECAQAVSVLFYRMDIPSERVQIDMAPGESSMIDIHVQGQMFLMPLICPQGYHMIDKSTGAPLLMYSDNEVCAQ